MHILIGYAHFVGTTGTYLEAALRRAGQVTYVGTPGADRPGYPPNVDLAALERLFLARLAAATTRGREEQAGEQQRDGNPFHVQGSPMFAPGRMTGAGCCRSNAPGRNSTSRLPRPSAPERLAP